MKKKSILKLSIVFCFTSSACIYAQQTLLTAGNMAPSATGSVAYSVGQVTYQSYESASGKVNQGVQQPYEIFALATNENETKTKITVYPNPIKNFLIVDFNSEKLEKARYQLFDATGRIINFGDLKNIKNEINTSTLSSGIYMLSILNNEHKIKNFKIIKHK